MIKIGILCYPTYGGSGIVATELGMSLANNGYQAHFISSELPARLDITHPNIFFHKINIQPYPLFEYQPFDIALSSTIFRVATHYGIDILHAHYAIPYAYSAYFAKQMLKEQNADIPLVTTLHGTDITLVGQHPGYRAAVEFSINKSDAVSTVSESLKHDTFANFNIVKNIEVIPNFIDNQEFKDLKCKKENLCGCGEKILIHVSNLRPVKRILDVLEIFKIVKKSVNCRLIIIGEGPDSECITDFLEQNPELRPKIKLMGKINDLYSILCGADLFLLPSEQESFGLAALEAMAASTPVVSSNAGGIPEVNIHGKTGYLADVGDVETMAGYAIKILTNNNLLNEMSRNAKIQAEHFDLKKILPMYENLYAETLKNFRKN